MTWWSRSGRTASSRTSRSTPGEQPIVAVNPDPRALRRHPAAVSARQDARRRARVLEGKAVDARRHAGRDRGSPTASGCSPSTTCSSARRTHVSARYRIAVARRSRGAVARAACSSPPAPARRAGCRRCSTWPAASPPLPAAEAARRCTSTWEDPRLVFVVREPFVSRHSRAVDRRRLIEKGEELVLESLMPSGGVIFSDGIEADSLEFNAGAIGRVRRRASMRCWSSREMKHVEKD